MRHISNNDETKHIALKCVILHQVQCYH